LQIPREHAGSTGGAYRLNLPGETAESECKLSPVHKDVLANFVHMFLMRGNPVSSLSSDLMGRFSHDQVAGVRDELVQLGLLQPQANQGGVVPSRAGMKLVRGDSRMASRLPELGRNLIVARDYSFVVPNIKKALLDALRVCAERGDTSLRAIVKELGIHDGHEDNRALLIPVLGDLRDQGRIKVHPVGDDATVTDLSLVVEQPREATLPQRPAATKAIATKQPLTRLPGLTPETKERIRQAVVTAGEKGISINSILTRLGESASIRGHLYRYLKNPKHGFESMQVPKKGPEGDMILYRVSSEE